MKAQSWADVSDEALSEEAIRKLHGPPENYRINRRRYEPGVSFSGTFGVECVVYVLSGQCKYVIQPGDEPGADCEHLLSAGDILTVPPCDYRFCTLGDRPAHVVKVLAIPEQLRRGRSSLH